MIFGMLIGKTVYALVNPMPNVSTVANLTMNFGMMFNKQNFKIFKIFQFFQNFETSRRFARDRTHRLLCSKIQKLTPKSAGSR